MEQPPAGDEIKVRKTPEIVRAERIAAIEDSAVRQKLGDVAKERDTKVAELRQTQRQNYERHVGEVLDQKLRSASGPQLTPPGMETGPYFGPSGQERAVMDARAEVLRQYQGAEKGLAHTYNKQIDQRLDEHEKARAVGEHDRPPEPRRLVKFEDRYPGHSRGHDLSR